MAKKIPVNEAQRKRPQKLSPSDWKSGVASLVGLGKLWVGHRDKQPLIPKTSKNAKSNNPATWGEWKEAAAFYERTQGDPKAGAGIMMSAKAGVVCLDLDHCLGADGLPLDWAQPVIERFIGKTYAEISLSGNGIHILLSVKDLPALLPGITRSKARVKKGGADGAIEFFSEPHFVTVSANVYLGSDKFGAVNTDADLLAVLEETGLAEVLRKAHGSVEPGVAPEALQGELQTAKHALQAIDPDLDRETWLAIGMALKAAFQGAGWLPWYEWSRQGRKFEQGACEKAWGSFQGTGVGLGTLYHHAREAGWGGTLKGPPGPRTSAREDFQEFAPGAVPVKVVPATPATPPGQDPWEADLGEEPVEGECPDDYEEGNLEAWQSCGLHLVTRGTPKNPITTPSEGDANVGLYLERHPKWKGRLRYNERTMEVELDGSSKGVDLHELSRHVVWFMHWKRSPGENSVLNAALAVGKARPYDPVKECIEGMVWDGVERLDTLGALIGLEDSAIAVRMLRRWCIGAVARVMQPGCEMQNMLVLHGEQGTKKSTFFKRMAMESRWYTESKVDISSKDGQMLLVKHWMVEMAELSTMAKAQVEETKAFISQSHADFRPPYGRKVESFPRRCVIGGTTNDLEWMRDGTGSRRFWVVGVENVMGMERLSAKVVGQIWAEAAVAYRAGERWWDEGEEVKEVGQRNGAYYQSSGLDALVEGVLANVKGAGVTSDFVLRELVVNHRQNSSIPRKSVAQAMERLGWLKSRIRPEGKLGPQPTIYRRPGLADPGKDGNVRDALVLAFKASGAAADFAEEPVPEAGDGPGKP